MKCRDLNEELGDNAAHDSSSRPAAYSVTFGASGSEACPDYVHTFDVDSVAPPSLL